MLSRGISTFSCVERIQEYIQNKAFEGELHRSKDAEVMKFTSGRIHIKQINVRYRQGLPLVLKNLDFEIEQNQKIGIIGRTGSGKSTLLLTLMRILELSRDDSGGDKGVIEIDGVDISKVGLYLLRRNLVVIPQDPYLLDGSLRHNIDPTSEYSDKDVILALDKVEFWSTLKVDHHEDSSPNKERSLVVTTRHEPKKNLKMFIEKNGDNLSQGQRQLICIARALVQRPKILLMDEATSSLDHRTNDIIQKVVKYHLNDTTVLTIAHRLMTIIQYDKLIVLQNGVKVEEGSPIELINKKGYFWSLVSEGEDDFVEKMMYLAQNKDKDMDSMNQS